MEQMNKIHYCIITALLFLTILGCGKKDDFLNQKPSTNLVVPTTMSDMQMLLDNTDVMNETPQLGILSSDEYFLTDAAWNANTSQYQKNAYIWSKDIYNGAVNIADWDYPYKQIFYANVVLEGLDKINVPTEQQQEWNELRGYAFFYRAYAYYNLSQIFMPAYDSLTANTDLGLPLRLASDVGAQITRSSAEDTYSMIINDLNTAGTLIGTDFQYANRNRPSKTAVYALLARIYLSMRKYDKALLYTDSTLNVYNKLIDYNEVSRTSNYPFEILNDETIYQSGTSQSLDILSKVVRGVVNYSVDTSLYRLYDLSDLRKYILFKQRYPNTISGTRLYSGNISFSGLTTDETYLIRAECALRSGNRTQALLDINTLLKDRWETGTYVPFSENIGSDSLLNQIIKERRKELVFRGLRWSDLRRLNKEGYNISLTRKLNGQTFSLPANSSLYILPIPPDEIQNSGVTQNNR